MDVRRVRWADWLTGLSGLALFGFLFIPWYATGPATLNAWEAFAINDVILAALALLAIALPVVTAAKRRTTLPVANGVALCALSWLAPLLITIRVIWPAEDGDLRAGAWLGLISSLGIFAFGWLAVRDERSPHVYSTPPTRLEVPTTG